MTNPDAPLLPLPGSRRRAAPRAVRIARVQPNESIEFTVVLRRRPEGGIGADPADVNAVTNELTTAGFEVTETQAAARRLRVRGTADSVRATFGARLSMVESAGPDGQVAEHRQRTGVLRLPPELAARTIAVLGIDDRPQASIHLRYAEPDQAAATGVSYQPPQLGTVYDFPTGVDGTGQTIAIIELGGGYEQSDLDTYFSGLGLRTPTVTAVSVDGATNTPGKDPQGADGEVELDIEVAGALAPGSDFVVYFAPNTDDGFFDAVSQAIHATPTPAAISISWGQSEDAWTAQSRNAMDGAFSDARQLGIVVTVAAGDNGSADGVDDGKNHCDFPASSSNVIACGGTSLPSLDGPETVWNDGTQGGATGGGVSDVFARPAWQADVGVPGKTGRGVPDVAGNADPETGYQVLIDGEPAVVGGTSAVAPLWAALVARLAQANGDLIQGFSESIYAGVQAGVPAAGFRDITSGNNGAFSATVGWDACTGLGSPNGAALLERVRPADQPPAATAQSGENPAALRPTRQKAATLRHAPHSPSDRMPGTASPTSGAAGPAR